MMLKWVMYFNRQLILFGDNFNPMKQAAFNPLPANVLADMYAQLARLEKSGIPTEQALFLLAQAKNSSGPRAKKALGLLKRGKPLAIAGMQSGLFMGIEGELVKVADASGTHQAIYAQLASTYAEKSRYLKRVKVKLIYPALLLIFSIFLNPLPDLVSGSLSVLDYLSMTVGFIIQVIIVMFILSRILQWHRQGRLNILGLDRLINYLEIKLPYFGHWYIRKIMRNFFQALGLMLQAGLPILEALPKAYTVVDNPHLKQQLEVIQQRLLQGDEFAEALIYVENLPALALPLISTGEYAGSLADALLRYVTVESEEISLHNSQLADWLPRLIYLFVVLWLAYHIVMGGHTIPKLPEGL